MGDKQEEEIITLVGDMTDCALVRVYVKDGKIIRVRPWAAEDEVKVWEIKVGDRVFKAPLKRYLKPYQIARKFDVYSERRVKYPLKRKDWEPGGGSKSNAEKRGESEFERISWEEAIEMAKAAIVAETKAIVATPHFLPGSWPGKSRVVELVTELQERLNAGNIFLRVYPGGEVYLEPELQERTQDLPFLGGQGNYLLVELPFDDLPPFTEDVLFRLRLKDIVPILAHPERNRVIGEDLSILAKWIRQGALVQVNAGSLTGVFGRKVQSVAEAMVKAKMVHFLGSDGHSLKRRPPILSEARRKIASIAGEEEAQRLCCHNAAVLLAGEQIEVPEPEYHLQKKGGLLRILRKFK